MAENSKIEWCHHTFNAVDGRPADEPMSTISSRGSQQQLVTASMAAYYGSEADGQAVTEPARTSTTTPDAFTCGATSSASQCRPASLLDCLNSTFASHERTPSRLQTDAARQRALRGHF